MKHKPFSILSLCLLFSGCIPTFQDLYVPPAPPVPVLREKNECELSLSFGTRGYTGQAAFAVTDRIGLLVDGRKYVFQQDHFGHNQRREHTVLAGVGAFGNLAHTKAWCWGIYGGMGFGNTEERPLQPGNFYKAAANYRQYFIQPQIARIRKFAEGVISLRSAYTTIQHIRSYNPEFHGKRFGFFTLEPTMTTLYGPGPFKIFTQFGVVYYTGNTLAELPRFPKSRINYTLGFKFQIQD